MVNYNLSPELDLEMATLVSPLKNVHMGAAELAQQLRALTALAEDLSAVSCTSTAARNHL